LKKLEELYVFSRHITFPNELKKLASLKILGFYDPTLKVVPDFFFESTNLERLFLNIKDAKLVEGRLFKLHKLEQKITTHFINDGLWKEKPTNVDYAMLAYAILRIHPNPQQIKPAMDQVINIIDKHIGADNLIAYSGKDSLRFVDTIGLVAPFLVLYANTYKQDKYAHLAFLQIENFLHNGLFKDTWIPVHSYMVNSGLPVGVFGWGRGTGWLLIGMIDSYFEMISGKEKNQLKSYILESAKYYLSFQRKDGGYGVFIHDKDTYDSSATAIFAYFFIKVYKLNNDEKYLNAYKKAMKKLLSKTRRNGALDCNQGDTVNVGVFSQRFDTMPFAQGMLLRAYAAYKN